MLQILLNKIPDLPVKEQLTDIEQSASHLLNLVNDILEFACLERETLVIRESSFYINSLVKTSIFDVSINIKIKKFVLPVSRIPTSPKHFIW